jgi:hypothetical protein
MPILSLLIAGIAWLVAWVIPGRAGRIASKAVMICLFAYCLILLNGKLLALMIEKLIRPAH